MKRKMRDDIPSQDVLSEGHEGESKIELHDELSSQQQNHYKTTIKKGADISFALKEQSNGEGQFKQSIITEEVSHHIRNKMNTPKKTQTTREIELKMDQMKRNGARRRFQIVLIPISNSPEEEGKEQFNDIKVPI